MENFCTFSQGRNFFLRQLNELISEYIYFLIIFQLNCHALNHDCNIIIIMNHTIAHKDRVTGLIVCY